MTRNHQSARKAGTEFETLISTHLAQVLNDDRIERRTKNGAKDRGDVSGVRTFRGGRVVIECKNEITTKLGEWQNETDKERGNDDAVAGVVVHKRVRKARAADQWVTMTITDFVALLTGERPE